MGLPWHNSASEMFVNLNIKSFGELLQIFVHGLRSRIITRISRDFMLSCICNSSCIVFIQSYRLGVNITVCSFVTGHIRTILEIIEIACTDCSFVLIIVLDIVFLYYICL